MNEYIHLFENRTEFVEERTNNYKAPWVSSISGTSEVAYNLTREELLRVPLTFRILSGGTFGMKAFSSSAPSVTMQYRLNGGEWSSSTITTDGIFLDVVEGDTIQFLGENSSYATNQSNRNGFAGTAKASAYGNIMSLKNGASFSSVTELTSSFQFLFALNENIVSVKNVLFPATTLPTYAYYGMFMFSNIEEPMLELPATELKTSCYESMFNTCTNLKYTPKILATKLATRCCYQMFYDCVKIKEAPELPATVVSGSCYYEMFRYCSSLLKTPKLPATTLKTSCYYGMFADCRELSEAKALPATTLASSCYAYMFYNCKNLLSAPNLPAQTLESSCYSNMFNGCSRLKTAQDISATRTVGGSSCSYMFAYCTSLTTAKIPQITSFVGNDSFKSMYQNCTALEESPDLTPVIGAACCQYMFMNCTSLKRAGKLPATSLTNYCYDKMFSGCNNLEEAPELPAKTLTNYCYRGLFENCSKLHYIKCLATNISAEGCTGGWVTGVAASGTFVSDASALWTIGNNGIPTGWVNEPIGDRSTPLTFQILSGGNISWISSNGISKTIEYRKNGGSWVSISSSSGDGAPVISVSAGDVLQFRGNNSTYDIDDGYTSFNSTCKFNAIGNIMSLIDSSNFESLEDFADNSENNFYSLFYNCSGLTNAENLILPATGLSVGCYAGLFYGCNDLVTPPKLPAKVMTPGCYNKMFVGTSISTAPNLPSTSLADRCYFQMFANCDNLVCPCDLPATILPEDCYYGMFAECYSLESVPNMSPTVVGNSSCLNMFQNCYSITSVPENMLPATNISAYSYRGMFLNCSGLTNTPNLPATELSEYCYSGMFQGCSSLERAPELPAKVLEIRSYAQMFYYCTNLRYIKCLATDITANNCRNLWARYVAPTGVFVKAKGTNWSVNAVNGIPPGWVILNDDDDIDAGNFFEPLTFDITSAGIILWKDEANVHKTIAYRKNDEEWSTITSTAAGVIIQVDSGDTLQFRGTNNTYALSTGGAGFHSSTAGFNVRGNIMSLIDGADFASKSAFTSTYNFAGLFKDCSGLEDASQLAMPAKNMSEGCYSGLFKNCSSLKSVPSISPVSALSTSCFSEMFAGCESLSGVSKSYLPFTTLATSCYASMFSGCTNLTQTPDLPASAVTNSCYNGMFAGCSSLIFAPDLIATALTESCYEKMFLGCASLIRIKCLAESNTASNCTSRWVALGETGDETIQTVGVFYKHTTTNWNRDVNGIPVRWSFIPDVPYEETLLTFNVVSAGNITWAAASASATKTLSYSKNGGTWTSITSTTGGTNISVVAGDQVQFKGNNTQLSTGVATYNSFGTSSAKYKLLGNVMSLLYADTFQNEMTLPAASAFTRLFTTARENLLDISELVLPATSITQACYYQMFTNCTKIPHTVKSLPAMTTKQGCYTGMFQGCQSLVDSLELPATALTQACYQQMFYGCSSLVHAPTILPAMTLAIGCYAYMFGECVSLQRAPVLPATNVSISQPYYGMFKGCTSLNYIKNLGINISMYYSSDLHWLSGASLTGTFVKTPGKVWMKSDSTGTPFAHPTGWVEVHEYENTPFTVLLSGATAWPNLVFKATSSAGVGKVIEYNSYGQGWQTATATTAGTVICNGIPGTAFQDQPQLCQIRGLNSSYAGTTLSAVTDSTSVVVLGNPMSMLYGSNFEGKQVDATAFNFIPLLDGLNITRYDHLVDEFVRSIPLTFNVLGAGVVKVSNSNSYQIDYKKNNGSWTTVTAPSTGTDISVAAGDVISFRGNNDRYGNASIGLFTGTTCQFQVYGNVMSLFQKEGFKNLKSFQIGQTLTYMFFNCTGLTDASKLLLPATTLKDECYANMFYGCSNLVSAPALLPATDMTTRCYYRMFRDCTSLVNPPSFTAETVATSTFDDMFLGCTSLQNVDNVSVAEICNQMFYGCTELEKEPYLNDSFSGGVYPKVWTRAFYQCTSMSAVNLSTHTKSIGQYVYNYAGLKTIDLEYLEGNEVILENDCFRYTKSATTVKLPSDVQFIGGFQFAEQNSITGDNPVYDENLAQIIDFDLDLSSWSATTTNDCMFYLSYLKRIVSLGNITSISTANNNRGVFARCAYLTGVTLPNTLTKVGSYAFNRCLNLTSINLPTSITNIEWDAFREVPAEMVINLPNLTYIGQTAFYKSGVKRITSLGTMTRFDDGTNSYSIFGECKKLTDVTIPSTMTYIGHYTFANCTALTGLTLSQSITGIGNDVFKFCPAQIDINLPNLTSIGATTFYSTGIKRIISLGSITSIPDGASTWSTFGQSKNLTSAVLPNTLTTIGSYAFYGCSGLIDITVNATTPPTLGAQALDGCSSLSAIKVPSASVNAYKTATNWSNYASIIQAI